MVNIWISSIFIVFAFSAPSLSSTYADIYKNVEASVVIVLANNSQNELIQQGTGFFINKSGVIITSFHIIDGSSKVNVTTADGHTYPVKDVLAKDISSDLACLSVDIPSQSVIPLTIDSSAPEIGDEILVIGYPEGPGRLALSMTRGIISSVQFLNEYGEVIQIDAAVSPGASGSPLINMKGEAIGVTTSGYIKGQRQNFAISGKEAIEFIGDISSMQIGTPIAKWNLTQPEENFIIGIDLYRKAQYNQSIISYEKAIELDPQYADAWYNKGVNLFFLSKYDEAIQAFDEALELNPQYAGAWCDKGGVLAMQSKYDEAIKACDRAIELDPQYADAWNNKGYALAGQGKYDEAIKAYDRAIELDPQFAHAWTNKGTALEDQGKYDEAIKAYNQAIELDPQYADAWYNKGVTLYFLNKHDEAIQAFDEALELNPQYAGAWCDKGAVLAMQSKYDEAIKACDRAIELDPQYADAWNNKGYALAGQGKYDEAIKAYDRAIELDPQFALAWNNRGDAFAALGRSS